MADVVFVPSVVEGCAQAADDLGRTVSGYANGFDRTEEAADQHATLASAQALAACRTAWSGRVAQQGSEISTTGELLHQTVQSFTNTDDGAATSIRRSGENPAL